jgi:pimeloyl-ACP methyl ester carboxylesterase
VTNIEGGSRGFSTPGAVLARIHCTNRKVDAYSDPVLGTPDSARALARIIRALSSDDLAAVRTRLATLTAPTLIVWGTGDHLFFKTKWAHRLADLIPATVAVHTIDGARMHFPDEHAEQFIPLLRQHWATHPE